MYQIAPQMSTTAAARLAASERQPGAEIQIGGRR